MSEQRALQAAILGALLMAVLGVGFAISTESEAILLDGVFSGVGFFMAILTLKISRLVQQPDDEHFQFGYAHFVPLINVIKSLLMVTLCSFALFSSVTALFSGGRPLNVGSAVIYGAIATTFGVFLAVYLWQAARKTASPLVDLDARAALLDAVMSFAVLGSFVGGWFLASSEWSEYLVYLDPALVTLLCLVALPVPLKILFANLREVLLAAPDVELQKEVRECFLESTANIDIDEYRMRMLKMGGAMNILVHLKPAPSWPIRDCTQLDDVRKRFRDALAQRNLKGAADIVFVGDMHLAD
jgi:cation diffusion facilitator family transporter